MKLEGAELLIRERCPNLLGEDGRLDQLHVGNIRQWRMGVSGVCETPGVATYYTVTINASESEDALNGASFNLAAMGRVRTD